MMIELCCALQGLALGIFFINVLGMALGAAVVIIDSCFGGRV